jgi:preprotein translocase subunit SecA
MKIFTRIFGTRNDKFIKRLQPIVEKITSFEPGYKKLSDEEIKAKTTEFREKVASGQTLDSILPEAFAVCREASRRVLGQRHYDVQLMGGIILHQGKISEMKTGEGKTLTATLSSYLHSLSGNGAHVITVNDYLAKRDAEWMGQIYNFLGVSVGVIVNDLDDEERKKAYACDITYGTNNEFGFDYLRDNMKTNPESLVQRGHNFAIVDEVDSILIDEARTPLIISGPAETNIKIYSQVNAVIPGIQKDVDYTVEEKSNTVSLTEDGISKMEKRLNVSNLYDPENVEWLHHTQLAVRAHILFKKDVHYVVRDKQILIVDEFTGRLMPGRRYSDGLHGALEAKEHLPVQQESQTLASITFQNYFRMYKTLSGMTGTADTEAVEFNKIYGLDVVVLPTNKNIIRDDQEDVIYLTAKEKFLAIADEIVQAREKGQPVLVGTVSVERSELLSHLLKKRNIDHEILNAKNHSREASIIANAGTLNHITIATNMAGRGTDIVLGDGVKEVGGLYVVATERHESRRIDNQLRGRAGRQGDPGKSKFFLSLEDDLMRIFASDFVSTMMNKLGMKEGESIISPMLTRAIERAQKRVEEQNFSSRKNLLEYDDVMNQQRQVIYDRRVSALLKTDQLLDFKSECIADIVHEIVQSVSPEATDSESWSFDELKGKLKEAFDLDIDFSLEEQNSSLEQISNEVCLRVEKDYQEKVKPLSEENIAKLENYIYLQTIDQHWKEHLLSMDHLKDSVSLRGYAQRDPLQEYKKEAFKLFSNVVAQIEQSTVLLLIKMPTPRLDSPALLEEQEEDDFSDMDFKHPKTGREQDNSAAAEQSKRPRSEQKLQPIIREGEKIGRNDLCPCGSGKKYKKCHGKS